MKNMKTGILLAVILSLFLALNVRADGTAGIVIGKVLIKSAGTDQWVAVKPNMVIKSGDSIQVPDKAKIIVKLADGSTFTVMTPKTFTLSDLEAQRNANSGKNLSQLMKSKTSKLTSKERPSGVTAVAGVRGADVDNQKDKAKAEDLDWK